ncbi:hypothetical protein [Acinetobacter sp. P8-3-8]|uniref:hypothetical protein n=1 Tax=Acinetobacter sp. P8-3-8 TaxID=1029823 RepID=UPI0002486002|nr:hypothetical protein [Acinetobacter sp. P8-3-8]
MYLHLNQLMQGIRQIQPKFLLKKTAINKLQTVASVQVYALETMLRTRIEQYIFINRRNNFKFNHAVIDGLKMGKVVL